MAIDTKPTVGMASAAQRGLDMRESVSPSQKCCFESTIQRARKIIRREPLTKSHIKRMFSFFSRHEIDKRSDEWKNNPKSKGRQAWLIWGGDAGFSWSRKKVGQFEREEAKALLESLSEEIKALK